MTQEQIIASVRSSIGSELCLSPQEERLISMNTSIDDLGLDSLGLVNVTQELEDIYGIKFPKSLGIIKTVDDLVSYVEKNSGTSP